MANIPRTQVNKIPGAIMPLAKETHVKDLSKLTVLELDEIKERGKKLLSNKAMLRNLADNGKRIQDYYDRIESELDRRTNIDETAVLLSALNIGVNEAKVLNELEWNGRVKKKPLGDVNLNEEVSDSDDEIEIDPFRILAQHNIQERQVKINAPEVKLITEEDLLEIKSFESNSSDSGMSGTKKEDVENANSYVTSTNVIAINGVNNNPTLQNVEGHVRYMVEKTELCPSVQREKFKPYKMTINNAHDPDKERNRKKMKGWEVTAATPPPIQHSGTKMITLMESVTIQANYLTNLKELYKRQAVERLAAKQKRLQGQECQLHETKEPKTACTFTKYREIPNHIEGEQHFNEDEQVHDPLSEEKHECTITYSVLSD